MQISMKSSLSIENVCNIISAEEHKQTSSSSMQLQCPTHLISSAAGSNVNWMGLEAFNKLSSSLLDSAKSTWILGKGFMDED